jgi:hypothetical protein
VKLEQRLGLKVEGY